ncbi:hypothetical protein [Methanobrevibacter sp.]
MKKMNFDYSVIITYAGGDFFMDKIRWILVLVELIKFILSVIGICL